MHTSRSTITSQTTSYFIRTSTDTGSIDPPTFTIAEYKPKKPINKKPIILVGKGVVYDTGGMSLKPTPNSMDMMKSDMGGAACMAATIMAVAKLELPLHVITLIPATDNRPGQNAYVPGDVIEISWADNFDVLGDITCNLALVDDSVAIYADNHKLKVNEIDDQDLTPNSTS